jgi:chemotaxis protein CheZ
VPSEAAAIDGHFTEILMAQEFHDLTGQLIGKTVAMAREMESELLGLLLEMKSGLEAAEAQHHGLEGPVFNAAGRTDVVTSQAQVDELLDSLGF